MIVSFTVYAITATWLLFFLPFHLSFLLQLPQQANLWQLHFVSLYGLFSLLFSSLLTIGGLVLSAAL